MEFVRSYSKKSGRHAEEGCPPENWVRVNATSRANGADFGRGLSPFVLGPIPMYDGLASKTFEAVWQFCKVYEEHLGPDGEPNQSWREWSRQGWPTSSEEYVATDVSLLRYPLGKGKRPVYTYWNGAHLSYIEARKQIYVPLYQRAVRDTESWRRLRELYEEQRAYGSGVRMFDFDGQNLFNMNGRTYVDALEDPTRIFGHSLILCAMLEGVELVGDLGERE